MRRRTGLITAAAGVITVGTLIGVGCQDRRPRLTITAPPVAAATRPALASEAAADGKLAEPAEKQNFSPALRPEGSNSSQRMAQGFGGGVSKSWAARRDTNYNGMNVEAYDRIDDNAFRSVALAPLSTFSVDVDSASFSIVRRHLDGGHLPPPDAVRVEELINYFPYAYPAPAGDAPFSVSAEVTDAPWAPQHRLVRIGLRGKEFAASERPACNLVFLIDTSGSMMQPNRLPLVKRGLSDLVRKLTGDDIVTIVTYAGSAGLALPATRGSEKARILGVLDQLEAGGSTNGSAGIERAYEEARAHFVARGVNRVMICTDGDFNVGVTDRGELTRLIEEKARSRVYLSVLGFGMGNYKDATLEELSRRGNGNYAYVDTLAEARRVLVEQAAGTLITIAKDVKVQVEFTPAAVAGYRLIGYENRLLQDRDFNDDTKDAGEIGAGHTVTALYEIVPAGMDVPEAGTVDPLKYRGKDQPPQRGRGAGRGELLTVKLRYKAPDADAIQGTSRLISVPVSSDAVAFPRATPDTRFAAGVAEFGMSLRASK